jgi:hypothetical protein
MPSIIIVEKLGNIKAVQLKNYDESELYKKAGFKTADGFKCHTNWTVDIESKKYVICVYGKTNGKANQENKYEFPPPIDTTLFFGNCILVNQNEGEAVTSLSKAEWKKIYEHLYGGFEDIGDEDSEEESEEDPDLPRTKNGYVKDGFVVDDSGESEDDTEEEEEIEIPKPKPKKQKPEKKSKKQTVFDKIETTVEPTNVFMDCSKELEEEEYL